MRKMIPKCQHNIFQHCCCDMLGVVDSNLMIFKHTQQVTTCCNKVAKQAQLVALDNVAMLHFKTVLLGAECGLSIVLKKAEWLVFQKCKGIW